MIKKNNGYCKNDKICLLIFLQHMDTSCWYLFVTLNKISLTNVATTFLQHFRIDDRYHNCCGGHVATQWPSIHGMVSRAGASTTRVLVLPKMINMNILKTLYSSTTLVLFSSTRTRMFSTRPSPDGQSYVWYVCQVCGVFVNTNGNFPIWPWAIVHIQHPCKMLGSYMCYLTVKHLEYFFRPRGYEVSQLTIDCDCLWQFCTWHGSSPL